MEAVFFRWLAFLMWMGMHHTTNEAELWSNHWLDQCPEVKCFFTLKQWETLLCLIKKLPPDPSNYLIAAYNSSTLLTPAAASLRWGTTFTACC